MALERKAYQGLAALKGLKVLLVLLVPKVSKAMLVTPGHKVRQVPVGRKEGRELMVQMDLRDRADRRGLKVLQEILVTPESLARLAQAAHREQPVATVLSALRGRADLKA